MQSQFPELFKQTNTKIASTDVNKGREPQVQLALAAAAERTQHGWLRRGAYRFVLIDVDRWATH